MNAIEIKEKRKELGLTQKKLAELVGVSTQTINGYENGKEIPTTKFQILDNILNKKNQLFVEEEPDVYQKLTGYNEKINQINEKIKSHKEIISIARELKDDNLIQYHEEIIQLLKKQIQLVNIAHSNHNLDI
jgi:transcriptional regulator with XRE-family HTH domain